MCVADSSELKNFGVECGLTNYAAAYSTGLLVARRLLKQLKMDSMYKGLEKANGELYNVFDDCQDRRPFKAYLDVGLVRTTTGNRVFGAMKGAVDGGINIPHNTKRFPGFSKAKVEKIVNKRGKQVDTEKAGDQYDASVHREHILGGHVQKYMDKLKKENKNLYDKQFSKWEAFIKKAKCAKLEDLYTKVHAAIRAKPDRVSAKKNAKPVRKIISKEGDKVRIQQDSKGRKWERRFRLTKAERTERVKAKIAKAISGQ